jgi:small-conductance mechanosensitive channel
MTDVSDFPQQVAPLAWQWLNAPNRWVDFVVVFVALGTAWLVPTALKRRAQKAEAAGTGSRGPMQRALFELLPAASVAIVAGLGLLVLTPLAVPATLSRIVAVAAFALLMVKIVVHGLQVLGGTGKRFLAMSGSLVTWIAWPITALLMLGWLEPAQEALDSIALNVAETRFSLLDALQSVLTLLVLLALAAYAGQTIERRLMLADQLPVGVRVGAGKTIRLLLVTLAVLLALNVLGIDLGGLAVFGGALGVGIGFGLQRVASNFVSGFILLGDRSIRPGDVITIGERFGVVRELRARYVVVQDRDGVDTLIPNENIITSEVINWSYSDRVIRLKLPVQVSYRDDPRKALDLMTKAAEAHPRVERSPAAVGRVIRFGESGIDLELRFWIRDPEDGVNNVRSDLYLAIWDAFKDAGITIPFPQRDVNLQMPHVPPDWVPSGNS